MKYKLFTVKEHQYIKKHANDMLSREIAAELDRDTNSVSNYIRRHGFRPRRKGWKGGGSPAMPIGTITVQNVKGMPTKMIRLEKRWKPLATHLMNQKHGNLSGYTVIYKDGDRMNCEMTNLELAHVRGKPKNVKKVKNKASLNLESLMSFGN